jgi:hypothetical protein
MARPDPATYSAGEVEDLAKEIFADQKRDVLIIAVFRDKERTAPHWLVRWSETGITRQALVEIPHGADGAKFRDLLARAIRNAALV